MKVQRLHPDAVLPTRSKEGDAGYDLYCVEDALVMPDEFLDIHIGIAVEFPAGIYGRIVGRSSTFRRRGLLCIEGIIDEGYRGELFAAVHNINPETPCQIYKGERLVQLIPMVNIAPNLSPEFVGQLSASERGADGFGSTGS